MKKIILKVAICLALFSILSLGISLFTIPSDDSNISDNRTLVTYVSNNDGDTARFIIDGKEVKCRFIGIDTPEINKDEPYSKEAQVFVEDLLRNASKIRLEGDPKADKYDKFDRLLVWVYVDDVLLQDLVVKEGLAKVRYIYDDYMYVDELNKSQSEAKQNKLGIWSNK